MHFNTYKPWIRGLLFSLAFMPFLFITFRVMGQEIIETVEVQGRMFSNELLNSRNTVIITREDLKLRKVKNAADLFALTASVDVARRGPADTSFDLLMRGGNFEQVLVLVDGAPFNNTQTGHFNTDFPFPVSEIERVEIIRGGGSTTYGAGAFAGVINIILSKESRFAFSALAGENAFTSATLNAGLANSAKTASFSCSLERVNTKGFHEGRELDQWKLSGSGGFNFGNSELSVYTGYLFKDFGAQGFYAPYPSLEKVRAFTGRAMWKQSFRKMECRLSYSYNHHNDYFELDRRRPLFFNNESATTAHYADGSVSWSARRFSGVSGFTLKHETMDSTNMGRHTRTSGALFINGGLKLDAAGKSGLEAGMRQNFNQGGHNLLTVYVGIHRQAGDSWLFKAGYSNSFRQPSFTELYYNSPSNTGDPALKPEVSRNIEGSVSFYTEHYRLDAGVYYRNQDNMLDWVKTTEKAPWRAVNIDQHDIAGIELTQQVTVGDTRLSFGIEKLFTISEMSKVISKYGLRFPEFSIKAGVSQALGDHWHGALHYNYKKLHNTRERGHLLDAVLTCRLDSVEISLSCDNILNSQPEEIPGVKIPGRWLYLGISHGF